MTATAEQPLQFKFYWLDENGNQTGVLRKKGRFDGQMLQLDESEIPAVLLSEVVIRENRMVLTTYDENNQPIFLAIMLSGGTSPRELKLALDAARSVQWAEFHREELVKEGRTDAFRSENCPCCGATLILTDMERTPQLYCHFCDTLTTVTDPELAHQETDLRLCEECGMFSKPRKFTIFYFWCLLVVYGWKSASTYRCPACMRGEAWKMFFGNLVFLIGLPVAVVQLIRSYGGGIKSGPFAGLDAANMKAREGQLAEALGTYREILGRVPQSAGLKYNIGLALMQQQDIARAAESFRLSLEDCSNYAPAYGALCECYHLLGETQKLEALQKQWGQPDEEEPLSRPAAEVEDYEPAP